MFGTLILLLIATYAGSFAHALGISSVLEKIDQANGALHAGPQPVQDCVTCQTTAAGAESDTDWLACVKDLCPHPRPTDDERMVKWITDNATGLPAQAAYLAIQSTLNATLKHALVRDQTALAALDAHTRIKIPMSKSVAGLSATFGLVKNLKYNEDGSVNEAESKAELKRVGVPEVRYAQVFAAQELTRQVRKEFPSWLMFDDFENLRLDQSDEDLRKNAAETLSQIATERKRQAQLVGVRPEFLNENFGFIQTQLKAGIFGPAEAEALNGEEADMLYVKHIVDDAQLRKTFDRDDYEMKDLISPAQEKNMRERVAATKNYLELGLNKDQSPFGKAMKDTFYACYATFAMGNAFGLTAQAAETFQGEEKKLLNDYVNRTARALSGPSHAALMSAAKKWHLIPARTNEEWNQAYLDWLNSQRFAREADARQILDATPVEAQLQLPQLAEDADLAVEDLGDFKKFRAACTEKAPKTNTDYSDPVGTGYYLSQRTAIDPGARVDVAFHEYSHRLSHFIQADRAISAETLSWYKNIRQCLNQQRQGKKLHEEEDWAEQVEALLSPEADDFLCATDFSQVEEKSFFSLQDRSDDPIHSGSLYVMLMKAATRRKIPASCRQALAARGETKLPGNCAAQVPSPAAAR